MRGCFPFSSAPRGPLLRFPWGKLVAEGQLRDPQVVRAPAPGPAQPRAGESSRRFSPREALPKCGTADSAFAFRSDRTARLRRSPHSRRGGACPGHSRTGAGGTPGQGLGENRQELGPDAWFLFYFSPPLRRTNVALSVLSHPSATGSWSPAQEPFPENLPVRCAGRDTAPAARVSMAAEWGGRERRRRVNGRDRSRRREGPGPQR